MTSIESFTLTLTEQMAKLTNALKFNPMKRQGPEWVIKIEELRNGKYSRDNAVTVRTLGDGFKIEIFEQGSKYHYYPETSIEAIAKLAVEFSERKVESCTK